MFSVSHNFLFVHIPRTGGNSIQQIIRHYSEDRIVTDPYPDGQFRDGINRFEVTGTYTRLKHDSLDKYHQVVPRDLFERVFKFCTVRNPWSRSISYYFTPRRWLKRGVDPYWSPDEFVASLKDLPPMIDSLKIDGEVQDLDFIMRFERLDRDVRKVMEMLGIPRDAHPLPHVNKGQAQNYRQYFDQNRELTSLVGELYAEDIERFCYRYEG